MNNIVQTACDYVDDATIQKIARSLGLSLDTQAMIRAARAAICGDAGNARMIEQKATAAGCACQGHTVEQMREQVQRYATLQRGGQTASVMALPIPGGQSGLGQGSSVPTGKESLDFNCRKDRGDKTQCEIDKITRRKYPTVNASTSNGSLVELTTQAEFDTWDLPQPPPGESWYLYVIPTSALRLNEVSQQLGLFGWTFEVDGVAELPAQVFLAAERIWLRNGEVLHALEAWSDLPPGAYEINKRRCRCVGVVYVCSPLDGRIAVAMQGTASQNVATLSVTWDRMAVQTECGPCPPYLFCDTPILSNNSCDPSVPSSDCDPCDDCEDPC